MITNKSCIRPCSLVEPKDLISAPRIHINFNPARIDLGWIAEDTYPTLTNYDLSAKSLKFRPGLSAHLRTDLTTPDSPLLLARQIIFVVRSKPPPFFISCATGKTERASYIFSPQFRAVEVLEKKKEQWATASTPSLSPLSGSISLSF